jgi:hypothetical protein
VRLILAGTALMAALASPLAAQSSMFGVRGLGIPGRNVSAHGWGLAGANGLFDPESNQNPASIARLLTVTAGFQVVPELRSVENPAGDESVRQTQFPLFMVAGPLRSTLFGVGLSMGNYTSRDFQLVSRHTEDIRGVPVEITDTLTSRGGLNDIRLAVSYLAGPKLDLGAAFHVITGVNRMEQTRVFSDTAFLSSEQSAELSYAGVGLSVGAVYRPSDRLGLGLVLRTDNKVSMDRDSTNIDAVDLPYTVAAGFQFQASSRLLAAGQATFKTWSAANSDLIELGGTGAKNTLELAGGLEFARDPRAAWRRPIRLGFRYAQLPFLLATDGDQASEFGITLGTGTRFAGQRGGLNLAVERNWRSSGSGYQESSWLFVIGISVRPALVQ